MRKHQSDIKPKNTQKLVGEHFNLPEYYIANLSIVVRLHTENTIKCGIVSAGSKLVLFLPFSLEHFSDMRLSYY